MVGSGGSGGAATRQRGARALVGLGDTDVLPCANWESALLSDWVTRSRLGLHTDSETDRAVLRISASPQIMIMDPDSGFCGLLHLGV